MTANRLGINGRLEAAYLRVIRELAEAESRRTGRDADDVELRIFFGPLAGALMAIIDRAPGSIELM